MSQKKLTNISYKKLIQAIAKTNRTKTDSLSEKQLNQLAKYTYKALTTGEVGSFRHLIYTVLKPAVAYSDGMFLGLLDFNNQLCGLAGRIKK